VAERAGGCITLTFHKAEVVQPLSHNFETLGNVKFQNDGPCAFQNKVRKCFRGKRTQIQRMNGNEIEAPRKNLKNIGMGKQISSDPSQMSGAGVAKTSQSIHQLLSFEQQSIEPKL
jgi:hypothetical protein